MSTAGAEAPDPQVADALSRIEPAGAILPLWVTMAVFGNLFAIAFLIHGLLLYMPRLRRVLGPSALLAKCLGRKSPTGDQEPSDQDSIAASSTHAPEPHGPYDTAAAVPPGKEYGMALGGPHVAGGATAAMPAGASGADGGEEDLEGGGDFEEGEEEGEVLAGGGNGGRKGAPVAGALERALGYEDDEEEGGGAGAGPLGSALPRASRGVTLEWRDVTLRVMGVRGPLTVLRGVGGRAPAGAVTALLGPSGAGKSSLLDLLAMRGAVALSGDRRGHGINPTYAAASAASAAAASAAAAAAPRASTPTAAADPGAPAAISGGGGGGGRVCCTGQVLLNGVPRSGGAFLAMSSYVPQEDSFLPQLTVREALQFAGRLLLPPPYCAPAAVAARAAAVAGALGLGRRLDNVIGGVLPGGILLRGLSGGERKRLNIGQGLLSRPRLLLLDEPTSGLDSFAAAVVMRHVADLAAGPARVAVVASLHQPRAAIWDMVDQAVVLARGRLMYSGPPYGLLPWFRDSLAYGYVPYLHGLVPDWVIDMVALAPPEGAMSTHGGAGQQQPVVVGAPKGAGQQQTLALAPADEAPLAGALVGAGAGRQPGVDGNSGDGEGCSTWQGHQQQQQLQPQLPVRGVPTNSGSAQAHSVAAGTAPPPSHAPSKAYPSSPPSPGACPAQDSTAAPAHMTSLEELNAAADAFAAATLSAAAAISSFASPAVTDAAAAVLPPAAAAALPLGGAVSPGVPDYASVLLLQDIQRRQQAPSASASAPAVSHYPPQHPLAPAPAGPTPGPAVHPAAYPHSSSASPTPDKHYPLQYPTPASSSATNPEQPTLPHHPASPAPPIPSSPAPTGALATYPGTPLATSPGTPLDKPQGTPLRCGGSWLRQYRMLVWREVLLATRNPADVAGRMLTFVWVGLFANLLTYSLQADATSIALRANLLFALVFFFIVMPFIFMSLFTADKRFFLQEATTRGGGGGGLYSPSAYYAAKVTATAPLNIIIAITFDWIGYGMLGLRHSVLAVVQHSACSCLMALISMQWVQAAVAFSPNQDLAFCAAVAFAVVNLLFSTQFLGAAKLTLPWIGRLRAISALDLTWRGMVAAEFKDRAFACGPPDATTLLGTDALGLFPQFVPTGRRFVLVRAGMTMTYPNCVVDTNALLSFYEVHGSVGQYVGWLVLYLVVIHIITYASLRLALWRGSRVKG